MIGFLVFSQLFGKNVTQENLNSIFGLLVMDQSIQFGLKILIQYLDDNKILTFANGESIPMTDQCKLVF
jgi:hypothetical protein